MKMFKKFFGVITALALILTMLPTDVFAAGSYTAYASKATLTVGGTTKLIISAKKAAGKFTVSSSNPAVATVSRSSTWVDGSVMDNNITIKAVSEGTATITVTPTSVSDDEYNLLTTPKYVKITVKKKATTTTTTTNKNNNTNKGTTTTTTTTTKSSDANLKSLTTSVADIDFKSATTKYTVNVDKTVTSLGLEAVASHSKATVKVTGDENFKIGENLVKVTVTAENGTTKTYELTVVKSQYGSGPLKDLEVKGYEITPEFDPSELKYSVNVTGLTNVDVAYELTDADSTAVVQGAENLKEGNNDVKVVVTEEDGKKTTYTIAVNVAPVVSQLIEKDNCIWLVIIIILVLLVIAETIYIIVAKKKEKEEARAKAEADAKAAEEAKAKKAKEKATKAEGETKKPKAKTKKE